MDVVCRLDRSFDMQLVATWSLLTLLRNQDRQGGKPNTEAGANSDRLATHAPYNLLHKFFVISKSTVF
jgi:hypothetical protein